MDGAAEFKRLTIRSARERPAAGSAPAPGSARGLREETWDIRARRGTTEAHASVRQGVSSGCFDGHAQSRPRGRAGAETRKGAFPGPPRGRARVPVAGNDHQHRDSKSERRPSPQPGGAGQERPGREMRRRGGLTIGMVPAPLFPTPCVPAGWPARGQRPAKEAGTACRRSNAGGGASATASPSRRCEGVKRNTGREAGSGDGQERRRLAAFDLPWV